MKSYKSIIASALFAGLALTATSCIGDLDLEPNDPNTTTAGNMTEAAYEGGKVLFRLGCVWSGWS